MSRFNLVQHCGPKVTNKICYEVQMLHFAHHRLCVLEVETCDIAPDRVDHKVTSGMSQEDRLEASAWLECFLIHARVLYDFFAIDAIKPDDVTAGHFVESWSTANAKAELGSTDKVRLNKSLAHLTTTRIQYDESHDGWDVDTIFDELCVVTKRFLASLPITCTTWFAELAEVERLKGKRDSA